MIPQDIQQATNGRRQSGAEPSLATINTFATSNSTSNHFLGASQRPWMSGAGFATSQDQHLYIPPSGPPITQNHLSTSSSLPATNIPAPTSPSDVLVSQPQSVLAVQTYSNPPQAPANPTNSMTRGVSEKSLASPRSTVSPETTGIRFMNPGQIPTPSPTPQSPTIPASAANDLGQRSSTNVVPSNVRTIPSTQLGPHPSHVTQSSSTPVSDSPLSAVSPQVQGQRASISLSFIPLLDAFVAHQRAQGGYREFEALRIALLREACVQDDFFYLCLHQVFCQASFDPLAVDGIGFGSEQLGGLNTLNGLLLHNTGLQADVLRFLARFPAPLPDLVKHTTFYVDQLAQVRAFLPALRNGWGNVRQACLDRGYPPSAAELHAQFPVSSLVLHKILFNSIHRQLGGIDEQTWSVQAIGVYDKNRLDYRARIKQRERGDPFLSNEEIVSESRHLGAIYTRLRASAQLTGGHHQARSFRGGSISLSNPAFTEHAAQQQVIYPPNHAQHISAQQVLVAPGQGYTPTTFSNPPNSSVEQARQTRQHFSNQAPSIPSPSMHRGFAITNTASHLPQSASPQQSPHVSRSPAGEQMYPTQRPRGRPPLSQSSSRPVQLPPSVQPRQAPPTRQSLQMMHQSRGIPPATSAGGHRQVDSLAPTQDPFTNMAAQIPQSVVPPLYQSANSNQPPSHNWLFPPLGQAIISTPTSDPYRAALHQAHLRSPIAQKIDRAGAVNPNIRLYQFLDHFILPPQFLGAHNRWQFDLPLAYLRERARDTSLIDLRRRMFADRSRLYRLRCIEVSKDVTAISEAEWVVRGTTWPSCCFISMNDGDLEIRRKNQYGRDMSIDLTCLVKEGNNNIKLSVILSKEEKEKKSYAVAIEVIAVADHLRAKEMPTMMSYADALERIAHFPKGNMVVDSDDVQIMDAHISIDLVDPFMLTIFAIPIRGKTCMHRECFDLETFLQTRKSGDSPGVTSPDDWKCPICRRDARPQNLVVDGFLQDVRNRLKESDRLLTKAILVQSDGRWYPSVRENEAENASKSDASDNDSLAGESVQERQAGHERNVIDLDD